MKAVETRGRLHRGGRDPGDYTDPVETLQADCMRSVETLAVTAKPAGQIPASRCRRPRLVRHTPRGAARACRCARGLAVARGQRAPFRRSRFGPEQAASRCARPGAQASRPARQRWRWSTLRARGCAGGRGGVSSSRSHLPLKHRGQVRRAHAPSCAQQAIKFVGGRRHGYVAAHRQQALSGQQAGLY